LIFPFTWRGITNGSLTINNWWSNIRWKCRKAGILKLAQEFRALTLA
jgi:hypothetical protein